MYAKNRGYKSLYFIYKLLLNSLFGFGRLGIRALSSKSCIVHTNDMYSFAEKHNIIESSLIESSLIESSLI